MVVVKNNNNTSLTSPSVHSFRAILLSYEIHRDEVNPWPLNFLKLIAWVFFHSFCLLPATINILYNVTRG